jgi:hypothetical protein
MDWISIVLKMKPGAAIIFLTYCHAINLLFGNINVLLETHPNPRESQQELMKLN